MADIDGAWHTYEASPGGTLSLTKLQQIRTGGLRRMDNVYGEGAAPGRTQ